MAAIRRRSVTSLVRTWQSTIMRRAAAKSIMANPWGESLGRPEPERRLCSGKVATGARHCGESGGEVAGLAQGTVAPQRLLLYGGGAN